MLRNINGMTKCCGVTAKQNRCSNKAKYIQNIAGAEFNVCKFHQKNSLMSKWDAARYNVKPPKEIESWLDNYYQCWHSTGNLLVSARFASSIYKNYTENDFNRKFEQYVNRTTTNLFKEGKECSVCYGDENILETANCGHVFCIDCLTKWCNQSITCPVCRTIL
tara:strand:- start:4660 stop:5151 length:492 start_codon:yes stop_codon:yes gene_type:complete